jgi:hypothetical protein
MLSAFFLGSEKNQLQKLMMLSNNISNFTMVRGWSYERSYSRSSIERQNSYKNSGAQTDTVEEHQQQGGVPSGLAASHTWLRPR